MRKIKIGGTKLLKGGRDFIVEAKWPAPKGRRKGRGNEAE